VFALHAAVLTSGYRLVAVGEQAQLEGALATSVGNSVLRHEAGCISTACAAHITSGLDNAQQQQSMLWTSTH
jgi:hypothetical protein